MLTNFSAIHLFLTIKINLTLRNSLDMILSFFFWVWNWHIILPLAKIKGKANETWARYLCTKTKARTQLQYELFIIKQRKPSPKKEPDSVTLLLLSIEKLQHHWWGMRDGRFRILGNKITGLWPQKKKRLRAVLSFCFPFVIPFYLWAYFGPYCLLYWLGPRCPLLTSPKKSS